MRKSLFILVLTALLGLSLGAQAEIRYWTDENGTEQWEYYDPPEKPRKVSSFNTNDMDKFRAQENEKLREALKDAARNAGYLDEESFIRALGEKMKNH